MQNIRPYIGLPYANKGRGPGYDCWGYAMHVAKGLFNISLPDQLTGYNDSENCVDAALVMWAGTRNNSLWEVVEKPEPGDLLQFRIGRFACHCGVYVGNSLFLHCLTGRNSTLENINSLEWSKRLDKIWRFHGR